VLEHHMVGRRGGQKGTNALLGNEEGFQCKTVRERGTSALHGRKNGYK